MTAFLLWILSLVLVWNVAPHLFLWSLKGVEVGPVFPYAGIAAPGPITEALVLGLQQRGTVADKTGGWSAQNPLVLESQGPQQTMYYAYPASYGTTKFLDTESQFVGGWDGANAPVYGPITIGVEGVLFYVYRTDYPNLGVVPWAPF